MEKALRDLLDMLEGERSFVETEADLQIGLLFELSTGPVDTSIDEDGLNIYQRLLPPELMSIRLDEDALEEIVQRIVNLFEKVSNAKRRSLFWAMSKVNRPILTIKSILFALRRYGTSFDDEASVQALFALLTYLPLSRVGMPRIMMQIIHKYDPSRFLMGHRGSSNNQLAELARNALDKLTALAKQ